MGLDRLKIRASSSYTPTFFFLHPQNFLNPKTGLNLLFEKGHSGYRKLESGSVLRIHQSE